MSSHENSLNVLGAHIQRFCKEGAVPGGIEHTSHAHHTVVGQSGRLPCLVSHDIQGIGYNHNDGFRAVGQNLLSHTLDNPRIGRDQIVAAHPRLARQATGDHDDIRSCGLAIVVGRAHCAGVVAVDRAGLPDIEGLALGKSFFDVEEDDLVADFTGGEHIGAGRAHIACTYYSDLGTLDHGVVNWVGESVCKSKGANTAEHGPFVPNLVL